jgi:hypothetical protein
MSRQNKGDVFMYIIYFLFSRERDERKLQQRTNPKGSVTVHINATDLFSRYKDELDYDDRYSLYCKEESTYNKGATIGSDPCLVYSSEFWSIVCHFKYID